MIHLEPIGYLHSPFTDAIPSGWEDVPVKIVVHDRWAPALAGLIEFSHLFVLFWFSRPSEKPLRLMIQPQGRTDLPFVGLFATRTPNRPNRLGLQAVELLAVRGNILEVRGLDALDETPVVDIKPYLLRGDCVPSARQAPWVAELASKEGWDALS